MKEAQRITAALKGHWYGRYGVTLCPVHGDTRPSLSIATADDGKLLLRCHAGCDFLTVLDALKGMGVIAGTSTYTPPSREDIARMREGEAVQAERLERRALQCWREAQPIAGTLAETYLRHRGITASLPDTLRFHPDCWHPSGSRLPAMVALVEGVPRLAVHRTYLRRDGIGKADIEPAKAMLGAVAGGAVRLCEGGSCLVVCEGIETGLSLASGLLNKPATIWAALSTSGMYRLNLPERPMDLTIATDGDQPGQTAGNELGLMASRKGWRVYLLPAPDGRDWNDVLMAGRSAA